MTLKECYEALGGDYEDVVGRLRSERLIQKFVLKFPEDGSYALLHDSLKAGNVQEAFRAAHTIKGMCQNLSFTKLAESGAALTERLRAGSAEGTEELLSKVDADYRATVEAIEAFKAEL